MLRLTRFFARLAVLCLLIAPALRADEIAACPQVKPRKPLPPLAQTGSTDRSVRIRADQAQLNAAGMNIFSGNAELRYGDKTILADKIIYDKSKDEFEASGNVRMRDDAGDEFIMPLIRLQTQIGAGYADSVKFSLNGNSARGDATKIIFVGRERTLMENARYTTCQPGQDDWFIIARNLQLDYGQEVGTARNATIEFKGVPIFYWPYLSFPMSDKRKSGFLTPRFANSDKSGVSVAVPYYFNIAPEFDATITPRTLSKRGLQLQNEARYLGEDYTGIINYEVLSHDRIFGSERSAATFKHQQTFSPYWSGNIDVRKVSDDNYFDDFGDNLAIASQTHLPRKAEAEYGDSIWRATSRVFTYQTIDNTIPATERPYSRLPQVLISTEAPSQSGRPYYQLQGELVKFERDVGVTGTRVDLYPNVSLPWRNESGFLIPKAGVRYTSYDLTGASDDRPSRTISIFSLDSGLRFERAAGSDFTQTLEPRLFYLYVPYRNQDQLPNFDTSASDLIFSNLFRENRFFGADRVGDANQATVAVTSRLLDASGVERLRASAGEIFYFRDQTVNLPPGTTNRKSSDFVAEVYARLTADWYIRSGLQWDADTRQTERGSFYLQYHPARDKIINVGHRFTQNVQEQVDLSIQWPVANRWAAIASSSYSLLENRNLESYWGFQYNACCWAARLYSYRRVDQNRVQTNTLMFDVELTGLAKSGESRVSPLRAGAFIFDE
jgi:LPS-assembly protein